MRDRPERADPENPRASKEANYLGGAMMTPERKRDAESSPNVSPPTDRHDSRPPLKKLALAEEDELAVTCPPLSVKSGLEEWDSDNATSARLLNPVMAPGYSSLVQEESAGLVQRTPTWNEPRVPRHTVIATITVANGGTRDLERAYLEYTRGIEESERTATDRFFRQLQVDQARLLDSRETRLVEMAENMTRAAEAHELHRQGVFNEALTYLRDGLARELEVSRAQVTNEANEAFHVEVKKNKNEWTSRMQDLQERLTSEWESQKALILREKDSQVAMLTQQSAEKLRSIRAEAAHAMEVRHMEETIHHESALNQLREDLRSAKRAHVEDVQLLAGESRKDIATLESVYEARDEQRAQELASSRAEVLMKSAELERTNTALHEIQAAGLVRSECGNCPVLQEEIQVLQRRIRALETTVSNEVNRTEGLEASLAEAGNSLRVSEQCTREAVEQLDHERVQFQLALQEQQKSRLDLERTTEDRVRAMITERESKGAEEVLLERTRVEAERGQLTLERAANEEVLARISEGLANQDANMRLLEDAEEQLRSDRENHEAMLAQAYAQLGRQQTNLEIEKRNATLKSQAERIRPSPILTPYVRASTTGPLDTPRQIKEILADKQAKDPAEGLEETLPMIPTDLENTIKVAMGGFLDDTEDHHLDLREEGVTMEVEGDRLETLTLLNPPRTRLGDLWLGRQ
ncbi:hypothetical protein DYB37_010895 [Aphanomyces astaci]|uniref:Uncharacterized protein n=1 Tax=Aphanomyces astaci TaxID=112090 RepID=A0A3R7BWM1_APHAT|nr:hypothetical protein DYB37_010895 [Aphanomyces astaci]